MNQRDLCSEPFSLFQHRFYIEVTEWLDGWDILTIDPLENKENNAHIDLICRPINCSFGNTV